MPANGMSANARTTLSRRFWSSAHDPSSLVVCGATEWSRSRTVVRINPKTRPATAAAFG